nr:LBP_cg2779 family protein [Lacticaseibacillus kribbianus]
MLFFPKVRYTKGDTNRGGSKTVSEKDQVSAFSQEIIAFQRKNNLTDTEMALNSHVSVEHIHNIKAMREAPEPSIVASLRDYMEHKPTGK